MICSSLSHIRHSTTHRPIIDTSDIIGIEGASRTINVHKIAITLFYLQNRGGFVINERRHHIMYTVGNPNDQTFHNWIG